MPTYRLDIAYDGTAFKGWAKQKRLRTVQGEIEEALQKLYGAPVQLTVAGRTDAGVHASAQVASYDAAVPSGRPGRDSGAFLRALNALTPEDIAVRDANDSIDGFDARRDALARRYRYRLVNQRFHDPFQRRYALHFPYLLQFEKLTSCAEMIVGTHDFTAFTPTETEHVRFERRVIEAAWTREDEGLVYFEVEADSFMRGMVRALVGTMLEVASGRRSVDNFARLLDGRPRSEAGETAPAHGLCLIAVRY